MIVDTGAIRLYHGDSRDYTGDDVDLVLTNPYGPLPKQLHAKPMIIGSFTDRKEQMEAWCGNELHEIARWHVGQSIWVANLDPKPVDLSFLGAEMCGPAQGWWPLDLPVRLLEAYSGNVMGIHEVWDGFCGRGTTGKACQLLSCDFTGIDISADRIALARKYLEV